METRHIKFDYEQALNAKKELLSSELNLIHMIKKLKKYKLIRKKEIAVKSKLKVRLNIMKAHMKLVGSAFPQEHIINYKIKGKIKEEQKRDIQGELEDIKQKLAQLK